MSQFFRPRHARFLRLSGFFGIALLALGAGCKHAGGDSRAAARGNSAGQFVGFAAMERRMNATIFRDTFNLPAAFGVSGNTVNVVQKALGDYSGFGSKADFLSADPNPYNTLLWAAVMNFTAAAIGQTCFEPGQSNGNDGKSIVFSGPPATREGESPGAAHVDYFRDDFLVSKDTLCKALVAKKALRDMKENLSDYWDQIVGLRSSVEKVAWFADLLNRHDDAAGAAKAPSARVAAITETIFMHPRYLLEN